MLAIDQVTLNFNPSSLLILNVILGVVVFGIALDLKLSDFMTLGRFPRSAVMGLTGQFLLLPAFTYLLVLIIKPAPSLALGMFLVAACPGGNISNFFTYLAGGNTALSICLSAVSTLAAIVMTPLNFSFWGSLYAPARPLLTEIALNPLDLAGTILLILGLPMTAGLLVSHHFPAVANRFKEPMKYFSMAVFLLFVLGALLANWDHFLKYVQMVAVIVFLHNSLAIGIGYGGSRLLGLPERDRRAVAIEIGIQNSGLALLLIFNFFEGLGGMALVAAWWGIWHIISGFAVAFMWSRRPGEMAA